MAKFPIKVRQKHVKRIGWANHKVIDHASINTIKNTVQLYIGL